jgi:LasA protease
MDKKPFYYKLVLLFLLVSVVPGAACNFPFRANSSGQVNDLQHTLTALATLMPDEKTPVPGNEGVSEPLPGANTPTAIQTAHSFQRPEPPQFDPGGNTFTYLAMAGDNPEAVAKRFGVEPEQIISTEILPLKGLLTPGQVLEIPNELGETRYTEILIPDSEVVNSPSARDFNINEFIQTAGGYLGEHRELVNGSWMSAAEIVTKVSMENSINPRLLLAFLELRSGWVYGDMGDPDQLDYPIGFYVPDYQGLYYELVLTATHLGVGYYGWRSGDKVALTFQDGGWLRMAPGINPGTAALQTVLSKISTQEEWRDTLYGGEGFIQLYAEMYGDPWSRASQFEPLIRPDLAQPELLLPFSPGERWSFTGGPHRSWNAGSPRGALDFSPATGEPACSTSRAWVTASAEGIITRASDNVLAIDLDGDGNEQTGWVLVYLHIVIGDEIHAGKPVNADDALGHPSCERGNSTGTHIHIARKYNGEWISAGEPVQFTMSGWETQVGERSYEGQLQKGDLTISANPGGPSSSLITRQE